MWLLSKFVKSGKYFSGIICLESASYINNMSNYPPSPLFIYTPHKIKINSGIIRPVYKENLSYEDTKLIEGNLYVTNQERTICEMIINESNEEYIEQCIENYSENINWKEMLMMYAKKYFCENEMFKYLS